MVLHFRVRDTGVGLSPNLLPSIFDPFVRIQGSPTEKGYNTNGSPQFDTKVGTWTHAIKVRKAGSIEPVSRPLADHAIAVATNGNIHSKSRKEIRFLIEMTPAEQWQARQALLRRYVPPKVRAYLNQTGRTVSPPQVSLLTH